MIRLTRQIVFAVALIASLYSFAKAGTETTEYKKYDFEWKTGISNIHFENETDSANLVRAYLNIKGDLGLVENILKINIDGGIKWTTGRYQSNYGHSSSSNIFLSNATVDLTPVSFLEISAGSVSRSYLNSKLLGSSSFLGIKGKLTTPENSYFNGKLITLYSVPNSSSTSSDRLEKEEEPSFTAHTIELETVEGLTKQFTLKTYLTKFEYKTLPAKVAYDSYFIGNSINSNTEADSNFIYQFRGTLLGLEGSWNINEDEQITLGVQRLKNSSAPETINRGEEGFIKADIKLFDLKFSPEFTIFYNESDSTPAIYNDWKIGHNNREGMRVQLGVELFDAFKIEAGYMKTDVINITNSIMSNDQHYYIKLETLYEEI